METLPYTSVYYYPSEGKGSNGTMLSGLKIYDVQDTHSNSIIKHPLENGKVIIDTIVRNPTTIVIKGCVEYFNKRQQTIDILKKIKNGEYFINVLTKFNFFKGYVADSIESSSSSEKLDVLDVTIKCTEIMTISDGKLSRKQLGNIGTAS